MKKKCFTNILVAMLLASVAATAPASAKGLDYNMLQATPIGSWQQREEFHTDHKGRETVSEMRTSLVGEEMREGEKHYWIEIVMNSFQLKKGKRKPSGDTIIFKSLVPENVFQDDPANAVNNLRAFGKEMVMQNGNDDPILIRGAGGMAESMLQAMGTKVNYQYNFVGDEEVTVKAGSFPARKIEGTGSTEMKVMFKNMKISSSNTAWISDRVPFGLVKSEGETTSNGKKSTHRSELLEFGESGATSQITKAPEELPELPNMKDLFGR